MLYHCHSPGSRIPLAPASSSREEGVPVTGDDDGTGVADAGPADRYPDRCNDRKLLPLFLQGFFPPCGAAFQN